MFNRYIFKFAFLKTFNKKTYSYYSNYTTIHMLHENTLFSEFGCTFVYIFFYEF